MTLPNLIFLDTSVFAGQQYNFESMALSSFVQVSKEKGLSLLLPAATSSEIERQIKSRSDEALKALEEARRKAPFLKKWKYWPERPTVHNPKWEVRQIAILEWKTFLSKLNVIPLGYEGIRLEKIMTWYDRIQAPFREGKKRKEFPDAFAIESLAIYAANKETSIAVVSEDQDFKHACEHFGSLLYFPSLPRLTERLLSQDANLESLRDLIEENIDQLEGIVWDQIDTLSFYSDDSEVELRKSEIEQVQIREHRIVAVGDSDCIVVFDAELVVKHFVEYLAYEGELADKSYWEPDNFQQKATIGGTAKLRFQKDTEPPVAASFIELDQDEIRVSAPYHNWYRRY